MALIPIGGPDIRLTKIIQNNLNLICHERPPGLTGLIITVEIDILMLQEWWNFI